MKLGFTSIYSWRPHVEQMHYLAKLARQEGHETCFLTCDSDLPTCYTRQMRPHRAKIVECTICRIGGIRSYENENIYSIGEMAQNAHPSPQTEQWTRSSAATLGRFESDADFESRALADYAAALAPAADKAHRAARAWIERENLEGLFFFNGRMDVTRAIMGAAKDAGIPHVSMERTWFGDGIQLLPGENCLGLKTVDRMVDQWSKKPLTCDQALTAGAHIAARFLRRNQKEWRAYNVNATKTIWPIEGSRHRILLLPGSRNEIWSHADWQDGWPERTAAYDALIKHFGLTPKDLVLRCHPNWGENIGLASGQMAENYYMNWAQKHGVLCIASRDTTSTMDLIAECDAIAVGGGSAALEAGALGKQVFALSPGLYQRAGFQTTIYSESELVGKRLHKDLEPAALIALKHEIQKQTLRFCYTVGHRYAQFVPYVRCVTTTQYDYFEGAEAARLTRLIQTGALEPDDAQFARSEDEENTVLDLIAAQDWEKLATPVEKTALLKMPLNRRGAYQGVDWVRKRMRRGDL